MEDTKNSISGKYISNESVIPFVTNVTVSGNPSGNVIMRFYNEIRTDYTSYEIELDKTGNAVRETNSFDSDKADFVRLQQASVEMSRDTLISVSDMLNAIVADINGKEK